jgi:hypothetical protein
LIRAVKLHGIELEFILQGQFPEERQEPTISGKAKHNQKIDRNSSQWI